MKSLRHTIDLTVFDIALLINFDAVNNAGQAAMLILEETSQALALLFESVAFHLLSLERVSSGCINHS